MYKTEIINTPLDKGAVLDKLARTPKEQQREVFEQIKAGAHRLEAWKRLYGGAYIDVLMEHGSDEADTVELWEIDENLMRNELSVTERAQCLARRKAILEARGDVQEHGGARNSSAQVEHLNEKPSFAQKTAEDLGVSERSVRLDVHRAENIDPEIQVEIINSPHDKGTVLDKLARTPKEQQREVPGSPQGDPGSAGRRDGSRNEQVFEECSI
jgi:hypothetical protein